MQNGRKIMKLDTLTRVTNTPNIDETPVVEIFASKPSGIFVDVTVEPAQPYDIDGSGLILYFYEGNRSWVKTSISKTPLTYAKKALLAEVDNEYLKNVVIVRGTPDFPLADKEIKHLSALFSNLVKDTNLTGFSSYTTLTSETPELTAILNNVVLDLKNIVEQFGFDITKRVIETDVNDLRVEDLQSGNTELVIHGLRVNMYTKLVNDNNPENGLEYVGVTVTHPDGKKILVTSAGQTTLM